MKWLHDGALALIALNLTFLSIMLALAPAHAQGRYIEERRGSGPQYSCRQWQGREVCGLQVIVMNN
jgi:hypothetical protein